MYRESDLIPCLYGLAGWHQNENPDYDALAPSLLTSLSGLYYQDAHPLVNIENLNQALKNYDAYAYDAYIEHGVYAIGDRIRYATDGKVYEALTVIADAPLALNAPDWQEVTLFSQKLERLTKAAANKVAAAMITQKKLDGLTKSIFENVQLFSGVGDLMNKEIKQGRFVGLEIRVKNVRDISLAIRRIGTQFSLANPAFKLWLFNSSQSEPVTSIDMNLVKANAFAWTASDLILNYLNSQLVPGGVYYLGYYEDDLLGNAINRGYNFGAAPACNTCNDDHRYFSQWSRFMSVRPFAVPSVYLVDKLPDDPGGPLLWDVNVNQYSYEKNYGLNLDLTSGCDITDFLCRENRLFTDALVLQVAHDALQEIAYSTRNNTIAKETRELAIYALNDRENKHGISTKLDRAIKAVTFDFSDLNDICFPCNNKNGVTYGTF